MEYLGHLITPQGLKPNSKLVEAVREFPAPQNLKQLRQFLGLSSYYRRFIPKFAKVAQPLHRLTKDTAYPSFDKDFVLETDASIQGIGAVLSQQQSDGCLHPVAYASRALSPAESHYSITELDAVVWAIMYSLLLLRSLGDGLHGSHSRESSALDAKSEW